MSWFDITIYVLLMVAVGFWGSAVGSRVADRDYAKSLVNKLAESEKL